ncbi:exopolyphosphatase [[Clostridium] innocuum]|nr:exopolyphosphatase [Erysipelotrichaceae bacterium]MCR0384129.1 exopolyphosphatase [[Clostridium] innocuum]MCR0414281.1 exopolyphosphatase [[Clostridium] innocuum]MCR0536459.1 exopolyphosphatase [[Clostridium] innocuum]MCR0540490.1 exopolyphosphatase [[Clostridium] innocuum]
MRLLTRSDFDGLACAVFLKEAGVIDHWKFVHPKDLQDGLIEVTQDDCLANVPFVEGCGLWFDHHSSEEERNAYKGKYKGESRYSPSCAHIIYDYYGGRERFPRYDDLLEAVDKVDSANLTFEEVLHPNDWILLGFIMDPRTGLGRFRNFRISNYALMEEMINWCSTMNIHEIMAEADVRERIELYWDQTEKFIDMVKQHTTVQNKIIISDLRGVDPIYTGNRFLIYGLYPDANISVWIVNGKGGKGCSAAVGYSIMNRTCTIDVGALMLKYGGGGHRVVGTCQFSDDTMEEKLEQLLSDMKRMNS